jgi:hypothetical protein
MRRDSARQSHALRPLYAARRSRSTARRWCAGRTALRSSTRSTAAAPSARPCCTPLTSSSSRVRTSAAWASVTEGHQRSPMSSVARAVPRGPRNTVGRSGGAEHAVKSATGRAAATFSAPWRAAKSGLRRPGANGMGATSSLRTWKKTDAEHSGVKDAFCV